MQCSCGWSVPLGVVEEVEKCLNDQLDESHWSEDHPEEDRLRAEELLASEEARRLHPHHILLMRAKLKITKCSAANMEQLQRKVICRWQL